MTHDRSDFHRHRARQHRLFAQSSTCGEVRLSHGRLAAAHGAVAGYLRARRSMKRPA